MTPDLVHPHLPRYAQAVTGLLCIVALVTRSPWVIVAAVVLVVVALVRPRLSPVAAVFRAVARPATDLEPVAPVRFSQMLAVVFLTVALALIVGGADLAGWIVVAAVAAIAMVSAVTGFCIGCAVYRLVLRGRSAGGDVRALIGLTGPGPWMVVLTAPGCTRCEPVARLAENAAGDEAVVRVDLSRTPSAARLPVASVPALLVVDADGRVAGTAAGRLNPDDITRFVEHAGFAAAPVAA